MTPEECAIKVVNQARATIDNWFQQETVAALRLAIAEYDQLCARRLSMWTSQDTRAEWPKTDGKPSGIGGGRCEGRCARDGDCEGEVSTYFVRGKDGTTWGTFRYCKTASESDIDSGFVLEERF